jgi:hypothetical protein
MKIYTTVPLTDVLSGCEFEGKYRLRVSENRLTRKAQAREKDDVTSEWNG